MARAARLRSAISTATAPSTPSSPIPAAGGAPDNDGAPNEVWFNDGNGNFTLSTNNGVPLGNFTSLDVELADFDGDGDLDALVANNIDGQPNLIWYNDGNGNFTSDGMAIGTFAARDVALGDIDGDAALGSTQVHHQRRRS